MYKHKNTELKNILYFLDYFHRTNSGHSKGKADKYNTKSPLGNIFK